VKQVENGLYAIEEMMPCRPEDIRVGRYALPDTLKRAEREEAAARILTFSKQLNQWVGVSWPRLGQVMLEDVQAYAAVAEAKEFNWNEQARVARQLKTYHILAFFTLGIYTLFMEKPVVQLRQVPTDKLVMTGVMVCGPQLVVTGIRELVEEGMVKIVSEGEGKSALDVLFPTPLLISTIMRKQGVVTV
jgi:hypothetical protein